MFSQKAADTQAGAAGAASQVQQGMFNQTQANLQPWMQGGQVALSELNNRLGLSGDPNSGNFGQLTHQFGLSDFQQSPAYQFNLEQGKAAIDKASASRGKFYNPSTLQDIAKYSQGLASNEYQNAFSNYNTNMGNIYNRLSGISGAGQNAAANLGGFSGTLAGQLGSNITGAGNAQAAGQVGVGNAITGGIANYQNAQLMQQMLAQNHGSSAQTNYIQQD